uniref:Integron gene cassette protein n=1 Tax=Panagrellus redivivus TaxID=6233 RepID=A0A7E4UMP9_PANRE
MKTPKSLVSHCYCIYPSSLPFRAPKKTSAFFGYLALVPISRRSVARNHFISLLTEPSGDSSQPVGAHLKRCSVFFRERLRPVIGTKSFQPPQGSRCPNAFRSSPPSGRREWAVVMKIMSALFGNTVSAHQLAMCAIPLGRRNDQC